MEAFPLLNSCITPLDRSNVDTDAIIPKQFLKSIRRSGFGPYLFDEWRYQDQGEPGMDCANRPLRAEFVLNDPRYRGSQILLTRANFGCGSSREHAPWALLDYGFRVIVAPSFADIFFNNCFKNGILPIRLSDAEVDALFAVAQGDQPLAAQVDLAAQTLTYGGVRLGFEVDAFRRHCLLEGLDDIGLTLQHADEIRAFEQARRQSSPWLFVDLR